MLSTEWLQGGPFLEVSFLMELQEDRRKTVRNILSGFSNITNKIEVVDSNIDEILKNFNTGTQYDKTIQRYSLRIKLFVSVSRKRKAILQIEQVSANAILVNFLFFGSEFDAPEWNQIGIKNEELQDFTNFLIELYYNFQFKVGGIAIEEDILGLIDCDEIYPNECYSFGNILPKQFLKSKPYFINLLWNEHYEKLDDIPYNYKRIDKSGLLIIISNSYSEF